MLSDKVEERPTDSGNVFQENLNILPLVVSVVRESFDAILFQSANSGKRHAFQIWKCSWIPYKESHTNNNFAI